MPLHDTIPSSAFSMIHSSIVITFETPNAIVAECAAGAYVLFYFLYSAENIDFWGNREENKTVIDLFMDIQSLFPTCFFCPVKECRWLSK